MADSVSQESDTAPTNLKQVLVELSFPPTLRVTRDVCDFYESLPPGFTYSAIRTENPFSTAATAGYQFAHRDGTFEIRLFEDSLTIACTAEYPGFSVFRRFILPPIFQAQKFFGLTNLVRVGLKYENAFYFLPDNGGYDLRAFLNPLLNFADPDVRAMKKFHLAINAPQAGGGLNIRSSFHTECFSEGKFAGQEYGVYMLDLDAFDEESVGFETIEKSLDQLHGCIKNAYNRHIKDSGPGGAQ